MNEKSILLVALVTVAIQHSVAYPNYRERIPNGEEVYSPCNRTEKWIGVGHQLIGGGQDRNAFGQDFAANGHQWTESLCRADSDGDGQTNGDELGDPNCTWSIGQTPDITPAPSHPGICEPLNDPVCQDKNTFLSCESAEFDCPAIKADGVFTHRVGFTEKVAVPSSDTTYMCQGFTLPDGDYHLIATESDVDNLNVAHHIVLYGCHPSVVLSEETLNTPYNCFMGSYHGCNDIIAVWSFGQAGTCFHEDIGFRIGGADGFKQLIYEIHWNNPEERADYVDASGMIMHLTPDLRAYDAGTLITGAEQLIIPPQTPLHTVEGICSAKCLRKRMSGPVKIVGVFNHEHLLGVGVEAEIERSNGVREEIKNDMPYDYNSPLFHILDTPVEIHDGDSLHITCHYSSIGYNKTTFFGEGTYDEMCYTLFTYYPKENIQNIMCTSFGEYDSCAERNYEDTINGCEGQYRNPESAEMKALKTSVMENCRPGMCVQECIPVAKEIHKNPCFNGTLRSRNLFDMTQVTDPDVKLQYYDFWYRLDSCLSVIQAADSCSTEKTRRDLFDLDYTSTATILPVNSLLVMLVVSLAAILF